MTTLENIMRMLNKNADDKKSVNNDLINQLINELPSGVGSMNYVVKWHIKFI